MSTFRGRTFQEVRDNLLTAVTGGVSAEEHPFPPPGVRAAPYRYSLLKPPVAEVSSVYGSRNREPHLFRDGADYRLLDDRLTLEWKSGGAVPDLGSIFTVNYRPKAAGSAVTDIFTGSVVRTVTESVSLEIARLYAQLQAVYEAAFIDTATGRSLENLVRLLDLERIPSGRAIGDVLFERAPGSKGSISIPSGTRVMTEDGSIEYETTATVTLSATQSTVRVSARDVEPNEPVAANTLAILPVPIAGITSVSNPAPTATATIDESDEELRTRAKNFLHGSERGTLGAIKQALARQGLDADVAEVFVSPSDTSGDTDRIEITPHIAEMTQELEQRVLSAIERVRPAGVRVRLMGAVAPKPVDLALRLSTAAGLLEEDLRAVQRTIEAQLRDYLSRLPAAEAGSINRIVGLVLGNSEVQDVSVLSAVLHDTDTDGTPITSDALDREAGRLKIGVSTDYPSGFPKQLGELKLVDPALPTRIDVVIGVPDGQAQPNTATITSALSALFAQRSTDNAIDPLPGGIPLTLTFAELVATTPLPGVTAGSSDPSPYTLQYAVTSETSQSLLLTALGDSYTLGAAERLSLRGVEVANLG